MEMRAGTFHTPLFVRRQLARETWHAAYVQPAVGRLIVATGENPPSVASTDYQFSGGIEAQSGPTAELYLIR